MCLQFMGTVAMNNKVCVWASGENIWKEKKTYFYEYV